MPFQYVVARLECLDLAESECLGLGKLENAKRSMLSAYLFLEAHHGPYSIVDHEHARVGSTQDH